MRVEVVLANSIGSQRVTLELAEGATAGQAQRLSGLGDPSAGVGVFGRQVGTDYRLRDGDRLEIYRPLERDPHLERVERLARSRAARKR